MWSLAFVVLVTTASTSARPPQPPPPSGPVYTSEDALRRYTSGRLFEERGDLESALTEFNRALLADPFSPSLLLRLSDLSGRRGEPQRSLEFADRALAVDPDNARALWLRGAALFNLSRPQESLIPLQRAAELDSSNAEYLKTLARVAESLDRPDLVARAFRRVVWIDDEDGEAWFQIAAADARLGRFAEADSALTQALAINPARPGVFFLRGWIRESLGHTDEAIALYRQHLGVHAGDQITRRRLIDLLAGAKRYPEAYREAQELTRSRPADPDALEVQADLALELGKSAEADALLASLRRAAPTEAEGLTRSVAVLSRHKRGKEGIRLADAWADAHPNDPAGEMLSARAHALDGDFKTAADRARRAVALAPDSLQSRRLLARILQDAKRWTEAESELREVLKRSTDDLQPSLDLAFCQQQRGDLAASEATVRDVLKRHPGSATALNFLGYLLADQNRQLEEAEGLVRRAVEQDPDNGAYVDSMGWVFYRLGRLEAARAELERAVSLTGGDPVVREHLGDVYSSLRLLDRAREQYRLSLAGDTDNTRVRDKLQSLH